MSVAIAIGASLIVIDLVMLWKANNSSLLGMTFLFWAAISSTNEQFHQNLHIHAIQPQRLLSWILSQEQLQDNRCLWTHLSIPLNNYSPEAAYQVLENAWFSWYRWWKPRFPKS